MIFLIQPYKTNKIIWSHQKPNAAYSIIGRLLYVCYTDSPTLTL